MVEMVNKGAFLEFFKIMMTQVLKKFEINAQQ